FRIIAVGRTHSQRIPGVYYLAIGCFHESGDYLGMAISHFWLLTFHYQRRGKDPLCLMNITQQWISSINSETARYPVRPHRRMNATCNKRIGVVVKYFLYAFFGEMSAHSKAGINYHQ